MSVVSRAVQNKREREEYSRAVIQLALAVLIWMPETAIERESERERSVATFSDGLSYLTQTYCGHRKENWTVSICERVK